jgi:hypothetical protein
MDENLALKQPNGNGAMLVTLTIVYDQLTGSVQLDGPTSPIICFGMLDLARQGFQKHFSEQAEQKRIAIPNFGLMSRREA